MKKIKLITLLFVALITGKVYGQDGNDFKKILIGVNFSLDECFRTLKNNDGSALSDYVIKSRNSTEFDKTSYTAGLNFCYNHKKNIGLETGIQYSNKGYQAGKHIMFFGQLPAIASFIYKFHYADIPLKVNFTFGKKKIRFFTSAGLTTSILVKANQTIDLEYGDGKTERKTEPQPDHFNRLNISPTISVGIDYKIKDNMHLRVEPNFKYGVLKIIDAPITAHLWNYGLNIGYYFGLK